MQTTRIRGKGFLPIAFFNASLGILQLGQVVILIQFERSADQNANPWQAAVILAAFLFSVLLMSWGLRPYTVQGLPFQGFIILITISGLLGMASSGMFEYAGLLFFAILVLRNYICFWGIPGSLPATRGLAQRTVLTWTLIATTYVAVGSVQASFREGLSLESVNRLGASATWLNPNTTGLYCAFGALICLIAGFLPGWIRLAVGALSLYCLLLSQSRTAIIALVAASATSLALTRQRRRLVIVIAALIICTGIGVSDSLVEATMSYPIVSATIARFTAAQEDTRKTARLEVLQNGLTLWESAPALGVGYGRSDTHFENGYLSIACESGALGLMVYLLFLGMLIRRARILANGYGPEATELGRWIIAIVVFLSVHAMGERSHLFQLASPVSSCGALLASLAFRVADPKRRIIINRVLMATLPRSYDPPLAGARAVSSFVHRS